jgi:hypothetical protein
MDFDSDSVAKMPQKTSTPQVLADTAQTQSSYL